jgi:hypothetical protein
MPEASSGDAAPRSGAATVGGRMGDAMGSERLSKDVHPPRRRAPLANSDRVFLAFFPPPWRGN